MNGCPRNPWSSVHHLPYLACVASELNILEALVQAHEVPYPGSQTREPIMFLRHLGGHTVQHHALDAADVEGLDEAMLEELQAKGLLDIEYREHNWNFRPTPLARSVVEAHARVSASDPTADVAPIVDAARAQAQAGNPLAWPEVRPVLLALREYWHQSGFPEHGVALRAILEAIPDELFDLFKATVRTLERGEYLSASSDLAIAGVPGEVTFLDRAHAAIDGWPGASSTELVENLLAVIARAETATDDPGEQGRLRKLGETVREVGVATAGDVLARAMMGGG